MRNTILLFGPSEVQDDYDSIWMHELEKAFIEIGFPTIKVDLDKAAAVTEITQALNQGCKFALGFQNKGIGLTINGTQSLFDALEIPYVNILLDTPYNPNSGEIARIVRNQLVLCMDESHVKYLNVCYEHIKGAKCMPLAGTRLCSEQQMEEKNIPILFVGVNFDFPYRIWHGNITAPFDYVLDDVADYALAHDTLSLVDALETVLKDKNLELTLAQRRALYPKIHWIYCFVRTKRRRSLIKLLANSGLCVDLIGEGWDKESYTKRLRTHGRKTYREILSLVSKAKIYLNDNGNFCHGGHERVFTGMLHGAVVVTDKSTYYDKHFIGGRDYLTYSWRQLGRLPHSLISLLNNEEELQRIAGAGQARALAAHTWKERAGWIVDQVNAL